MKPQQNSRDGRLRWFGTMLLFASGVVLTSSAAWLLWEHLQAWKAWDRWESLTVGQWLETRAARDLLPDGVRKLFVGMQNHPAPLQDVAEAISVWALCLVAGAAFLWRAIRWKD